MVNLSQGKANSMRGVRRDRYLQATALGLLLALGAAGAQAQETEKKKEGEDGTTVLETITVLSAEDQLKQMPGVSTITASDLQKTPVTNDISEIIRKMPGVNLTGSSASGSRGNQRQIDLRGMGPENTLILIDGKPVLSRNSVRMGRAGERDSRGDTNWVPAEAIERIEVIRGPAAARYGSGAAGGVVNIITKRPDRLTTTVSTHVGVPQHSEEGRTFRGNIVTGGPINDYMSFRLTGNYNKTQGDSQDINAGHTAAGATAAPAGREGVENRDLRALLSVQPTDDHTIDLEGSWSRQGNIYAGDTLNSIAPTTIVNEMIGKETNVMRRGTMSLTHKGEYDFGDSMSYIQWENTINRRLNEALAGGPEGSFLAAGTWGSTKLNNLTAKSEWNLPVDLGVEQKVTLGTEFRGEWMEDSGTVSQSLISGVQIPGTPTNPADRSPKADTQMVGLYVEDNIQVTDRFMLTPGVRFDYHTSFGANWSPSLNASYEVTDELSLKAGIARAFKAPNLFQLNPNYVYYTMGNGCPVNYPAAGGVGCYVVGNADLDAETSLNKEFGINYHNDAGWNAGLTWFHNDYRNRIATGLVPIASADPATSAGWLLRWENVPEAVISGLEGNLSMPLHENLTWSTNATYMIESKNKSNGQPLTLIPEYTINTALDWQAREDLLLTLSATRYGKTESPVVSATTGGLVANPAPRDPYTLVNFNAKYDINETYRVSAGVTNIFDKRVFREGSGSAAGANTYNEPGRTFYVSLSATF